MTATVPATPRRELLLAAAAELFAERGFHAVGIDDIGVAAGISGPGVYRHFPSKQALLESLVDQAMTHMLAGAQEIVGSGRDARTALESLVVLHVGFAVDQRELIGVWVRETRALSDQWRRSLRQRMRAYEQPWQAVLTPLREDLSHEQVAMVVSATIAMLNGTAFTVSPGLHRDGQHALLRRMALAALLARDDHPTG